MNDFMDRVINWIDETLPVYIILFAVIGILKIALEILIK